MSEGSLDQRIRAILCKLSTLAEASQTTNWVPSTSHAKPGSRPPTGFSEALRGTSDGTPPKDRSLYEWYIFHFTRAADDLRRWKLVYLAESDYARYRGIDRRELIAARRRSILPDGFEDETQAMARVVEWYRGWEVLEVAIYEHCSPEFVKKARRTHRRSEKDGIEKSGWRGWSEERREAEVRKAILRRGRSVHKVAGELDVSEKTVSPYVRRVLGTTDLRRAA